jgi:hypothetical protein
LKYLIWLKNKEVWVYGLLSLIVLIWGLNFIYLPNSPIKRFDDPDEVQNIVRSLNFYHALQSHNLNNVLFISREYPPLMYLVTSCCYAVLGTSLQSLYVSYGVFLFIFFLGLYLLGRWLGEREYAWILLALGLFSPAVIQESSIYLGDLPVLAFLTLSLYFLLKAQHFTQKKYAWSFGIISGLGLLTKFTFVYFWLPLLACELFYLLKRYSSSLGRWLLSLLSILSIMAAAITALWVFHYLAFPTESAALAYALSSGLILAAFWLSRQLSLKKDSPETVRVVFQSLLLILFIALPWYLVHTNDFISKVHTQALYFKEINTTFGELFSSYFGFIVNFLRAEALWLSLGLIFALLGYYRWETVLSWAGLITGYLLVVYSSAIHLPRYILPALILILIPATAWVNVIMRKMDYVFKVLGYLIILGLIIMAYNKADFPVNPNFDDSSYKLYLKEGGTEEVLTFDIRDYHQTLQELSSLIIKDYKAPQDFSAPLKIIIFDDYGVAPSQCSALAYYLASNIHQEFYLDYMRNRYQKIDSKNCYYLVNISKTPYRQFKLIGAATLKTLKHDSPYNLNFELYKI